MNKNENSTITDMGTSNSIMLKEPLKAGLNYSNYITSNEPS